MVSHGLWRWMNILLFNSVSVLPNMVATSLSSYISSVPNSYRWLMAALLSSANIEHFHHHRNSIGKGALKSSIVFEFFIISMHSWFTLIVKSRRINERKGELFIQNRNFFQLLFDHTGFSLLSSGVTQSICFFYKLPFCVFKGNTTHKSVKSLLQ